MNRHEKVLGDLVQVVVPERIEGAVVGELDDGINALHRLGYDGSYGRVAAFVRAWKADRQRDAQTSGRGTFVPLVFAPGEAFQFDWSEDWAVLGGERAKLQVAHTKLSHSRAFVLRAYPLPRLVLRFRRGSDP